ncbi:MAG: FAD-dependent oxidoreductase [Pseudomonadota bacterium]
MFVDLSVNLEPIEHDICVVGSGIIGLSIAHFLEANGLRVLMLEAGDRWPTDENIERNFGLLKVEDTHSPIEEASRRALGGNSYQWGGRCVPLDPIDLKERDWIPDSGWPIDYGELEKWHAAAAEFLRVKNSFEAADLFGDNALINFRDLERWMPNSNVIEIYSEWLARSDSVQCILNAPVVGFEFDQEQRIVENVVVKSGPNQIPIKVNELVIACGGVNTTRLLLNVQKQSPHLFGGMNGPLGRYYMGHIYGKISTLKLTYASDFSKLNYTLDGDHYSRQRISIAPETQEEFRLPQVTFTAGNPVVYDAAHKSGTFSMIWLALVSPIGHKFLTGPLRKIYVGEGSISIWPHIWNVVRRPFSTIAGTLAVAKSMFFQKPRTPTIFVENKERAYALYYHAEQTPLPENRISLSEQKDDLGMYRVAVTFECSTREAERIVEAHKLLQKELESTGFGTLEFIDNDAACIASLLRQAKDGLHQIGSTRMSLDPKDGVVNADCKIHDLDNAYIASTSVFPTSGQANPTFAGVALALRLGKHLIEKLRHKV